MTLTKGYPDPDSSLTPHPKPPPRCLVCRQLRPPEAFRWRETWGRYELLCDSCVAAQEWGRQARSPYPPSPSGTGPTPYKRWCTLHTNARARDIAVLLSYAEFRGLIVQPCAYCGERSMRINLDRLDSRGVYDLENVVPCCGMCNRMKSDATADAFLEQVRRIARHWGLR